MFAQVSTFLSQHWLDIPAFLFVITIVVFFHELGHFAVARWCRVTVQVFSIGFGRELVGWTDRKGTRWRLSWIPFGGYVKFLGDADVSSRPDEDALQKADSLVRAGMLHFKPLYQRAAVAAAGPVANFILAIVIFAGLFMTVGRQVVPPVINSVQAASAAEEAGLRAGDRILAVDGKPIHEFSDIQRIVEVNEGESLTILISRNRAEITIRATPRIIVAQDPFGGNYRTARLGLLAGDNSEVVRYGPGQAFTLAVDQTWLIVDRTMNYLGKMITGRESAEQLSGPIGIARVSGKMAEIGILALINLTALLSVSIGLLNLFPVPVLDGGHLLYYACEAVLGRPLGERAQEVGFRLGLALVLSLMLLATFNDLVRLNLF